MQITASQLQSQHKALIDALKRGERVEISYHGQLLGVVHPVKSSGIAADEMNAMGQFFGMHQELDAKSVEDELRLVRKGRLGQQRDN